MFPGKHKINLSKNTQNKKKDKKRGKINPRGKYKIIHEKHKIHGEKLIHQKTQVNFAEKTQLKFMKNTTSEFNGKHKKLSSRKI